MGNKELIKGTLNTIILQLLSKNGRMYGYEITQAVKEISNGQLLLKEGSLYPALHRMEAEGLLTVEEVMLGKRVRRYYVLSEEGKLAVKESVHELLGFLDMMHRLITNHTVAADGTIER